MPNLKILSNVNAEASQNEFHFAIFGPTDSRLSGSRMCAKINILQQHFDKTIYFVVLQNMRTTSAAKCKFPADCKLVALRSASDKQ